MRDKDYGRGRCGRVVCRGFQDRDERASAPTRDRGEFGDLRNEHRDSDTDQAEIEALKDELDDKTLLVRVLGWSLLIIGAVLIV